MEMMTVEKKLRVLAVEDSEDDFELIRNELAEGGFMVEHERVETAEKLRRALEFKLWDVVICDHNLPALDSISALHIVRKTAENTPFIIVSGLITHEVAAEAMRLGVRNFICKDNLSRLALAVEWEVRQAAMRTELEHAPENLPGQDEEPGVGRFFIDLVSDNINVINTVIAAIHPGYSWPAIECERLSAAIRNIRHAADAMGYPAVHDELERIEARLPAKGKAAERRKRIGITKDLLSVSDKVMSMICLEEAALN